MNAMKLTASERIAAFAHAFDTSALSESHWRACTRSLADTLAVAIAGTGEHASQCALRYLDRSAAVWPSDSPHACNGAHLWGTDRVATAETAALFNGISGHVLDYDDVTVPLRGHPSIALWPALVALAEVRDLPGERLGTAFVVGFEVIGKLARVMATSHYQKGWHSTATIGLIGASVACSYLLGLDATGIVNAIGLAVAQAGGVRENVGTEAKSFQAGHCGAAAVRAVLMAESGFMASASALDGPHGYMSLYGEGQDLTSALDSLGHAPIELEHSGIDVKQYPLCYATHRALDGVLAMRAEHRLSLADVIHMHIETSRGALIPLTQHRPQTGLAGKFSIEYAMAAALSDGFVRLTSFTDEAVKRPSVQAFFDRITISEAGGSITPRWVELRLSLGSGHTLNRRVETLHGSTQDPLSEEELLLKITDCLAWAASPLDGGRLLEAAYRLRHLATREFLNLVAFRPSFMGRAGISRHGEHDRHREGVDRDADHPHEPVPARP